MLKLFALLRRDERGISSIEYAMLAVGVALAILAGAQFLGNSVNSGLMGVGSDITNQL